MTYALDWLYREDALAAMARQAEDKRQVRRKALAAARQRAQEALTAK